MTCDERKRRASTARRSARRGVALLIVSIVIAMLTLGGATLLLLMKTEREATTTRGREALVKSVDRSAVVFLLGTLETSRAERDKIGGLYDNPKYFCAAPLLTVEEGGDETSRFTVVSPKFDKDKIEGVRYGLVDESTRLNLAAVLDWDAESPGAGRAALMKLPGMTTIAADSILDWIDADEKARPNGGESKYYAQKNLPYSPRNAVPVFLEELLLARGVTRLQLYGTDEDFTFGANRSGADGEASDSALGGSLASPPALLATSSETTEAVPWKELLTVFSAEKDVDPNGEARIDLNEDDLQFLYRELSERVGDELAKFVVWFRQYGPADDEEDEENVEKNASTAVPKTVDFSVPATVALETPLDLVGATVSIDGARVESPLAASRSKANADKLFQFLDFASTSESTTIVGRVDVNGAPSPVLAAIPGLTAADARKILDARPNPKEPLPSDFRHAAWLYTKGVVNLAKMKSLYKKTTAFGDVFRGQIVGFLDGTNVSARADVVVDGTTNPPRQVFYKDLSMTGKGFSDAVLLGGLTSNDANASGSGAFGGGTDADWNAVDGALGVVEIENDRASGYANPFAAVDRAIAAPPPNAAPNGAPNAFAPSSPIGVDVGNGVGVDANFAPLDASPLERTGTTKTMETGTASTVTAETETTESSDSAQEDATAPVSRKDRLLNALRSARETRRASNEAQARESGAVLEN